MDKATLVVMAAGIGSRFGGGIKQLEPIGPNGELIIDYSIYDALKAGFSKVVFVIRKELEKDFKEIIGKRIEKCIEVAYVFQEIDDIPAEYSQKAQVRKKPWGTGQAILCCRNTVKEPFLVINADDYYGKEAYQKAFQILKKPKEKEDKLNMCMVGFLLANTLSEHGTVTRGVCQVDESGMLKNIEETYEIRKKGDQGVAIKDGQEAVLPLESTVSMNMWGFWPDIFPVLEAEFQEFLATWDAMAAPKREYLLPEIIGKLLQKNLAKVSVLSSSDRWFGVTYKEDKEGVAAAVRALVASGVYPEKLY